MKQKTPGTIFTVGHSTRTNRQFIDLLQVHGVKEVVDVRIIPRSRHNPQFGKDKIAASLKAANTSYRHIENLGGLRRAKKDSANLGWRNASFRGFADYMATPAFVEGLGELLKIARLEKTAIMCAEAVPWRCYRPTR